MLLDDWRYTCPLPRTLISQQKRVFDITYWSEWGEKRQLYSSLMKHTADCLTLFYHDSITVHCIPGIIWIIKEIRIEELM